MVRKFFAGLLLVLFTLLSLPFALGASALSLFLNRDFYTGNFSNELYDFVGDTLVEKSVEMKLPVSGDEAAEVFKAVISEEDMRDLVGAVWDELAGLRVDESGATIVKLPVDLIAAKSDKFAAAMATQMVEKIPKCGSGQNLPENFSCLPESLAKEDLELLLKRVLDQEIFSSLPDQFVLNTNLPEDFSGGILEYLKRVLNVTLLACALIFLLILFLIGLIIFRPWSRIFKWISATIFFAAFVNSVVFTLLFLAAPFMIPKFEFAGFATLIVFSLAQNLLIWSIPVLLLFLALWIYLIYHDSRRIA